MRIMIAASLTIAALMIPRPGATAAEEKPASQVATTTSPDAQETSPALRELVKKKRSALVEMMPLVQTDRTKRANRTYAPAVGNPGKPQVAVHKLPKREDKPSTAPKIFRPITREETGVEIQGIRTASNGYMLDFRYKVIDAEKAAPLFKRSDKPYLIDQKTGGKFAVPNMPKVGPLRNSNPPVAGKTYFMFFGNPGQYIKPGAKVSVVIGEYKVEDLVVQ